MMGFLRTLILAPLLLWMQLGGTAGAAAMQGRRRSLIGVTYLADYSIDSSNGRTGIAAFTDPRTDGGAFIDTGWREGEATWPTITGWVDAGSPGEVTGIADPFGGTDAVTTEDNDNAVVEGHVLSFSHDVYQGVRYRVIRYVKKDSDTSRVPEFQHVIGGSWAHFQINTQTGASTIRSQSGFRNATLDVITAPEDSGWWKCTLAFTNNVTASSVTFRTYPAMGASLGTTGATNIGALTWYPQIELQGQAAYLRDGVSRIYPSDGAILGEGTRANLVTESEKYDAAAWTVSGTTVVQDSHDAPDGKPNAATLQFTASAGAVAHTSISGTADGEDCAVSVYARVDSGTKNFRLIVTCRDNVQRVAGTFTATTTWQRFSGTVNLNSGATTPLYRIVNEGAGTAGDLIVWGSQFETACSFASSYIPTAGATATRNTDTIDLPNSFLLAVHNGRHVFDLWHLFPSSELASGSGSRRTWSQSGGNVGHMTRGVAGGTRSSVIQSSGGPLSDIVVTFDPLQKVTNEIDLTIAGETIRSGYTTGNGTSSFTARAALSASGATLYIGQGPTAGAAPAFSVISRPRAA